MPAFGNVTVQESPTLVMCGAGTWRRRTAIQNVTVPPGLIATRAGLPLVGGGAVDLLAALGLAEGAAEEREAGGTDVKQWQAQMAYRAWRVEG